MHGAIPIFALLVVGQALPAQNAVKAFDVASIKPHDPKDAKARLDLLPGGRVIMHNVPARFLFEYSWGVQPYETSGEPAWFDERYDIDAIAQSAGEMTDAQVKPLLRALLEDRLKLAAHREKKELPIYDLVVAPGGPKFKASTPDETPAVTRTANGLKAKKIPLTSVANFLSGHPDILRRVTDQTGLTGDFDFDLQWTPESAALANSGPSIYTAVTEQLGLKLVAKKGIDEVVVIDHVERPSEN